MCINLGNMIALHVEPYLNAKRDGFGILIKTLDPQYKIPAKKYFLRRSFPRYIPKYLPAVVGMGARSSLIHSNNFDFPIIVFLAVINLI